MKKLILLLISLLLVSSFVGCEKLENEEIETEYVLYYLNREETKLETVPYSSSSESDIDLIEELLFQLQQQPKDLDKKASISTDIEIISAKLEEKQIIVNLGTQYYDMEFTKEILVRAAIVRTLTQLPSVEFVNLQIGGNPIVDKGGMPIGVMTVDTFIDNEGAEINTYEKVKLKLYLANEKGNALKEVSRVVIYNSNISMDKLIVEQLIAGPANTETYATLNPDTKLISVTTKDGICYVNFDENFLAQGIATTPDVTIYSITNSLVELSNINKVQILINGKDDVMYREAISLKNALERNLDIVE